MNYKIKILEKLNSVKNGSNRISINNLEIIVNVNEKISLLGGEFLQLLGEMKKDGLVSSEDDWYFSITEEGIKYLLNNSSSLQ